MAVGVFGDQIPSEELGIRNDHDSRNEASTALYSEHEPFETYQDKVRRLCVRLWPTYSGESFSIKHLDGGYTNRVVGVSVIDTKTPIQSFKSLPVVENQRDTFYESPEKEFQERVKSYRLERRRQKDSSEGREVAANSRRQELPPGSYVLRIPRRDHYACEHEIAMLRFVAERITIDVPTVVHFDLNGGDNNPLESPYVLQPLIPGKRLDYVWPSLSHTRRLLITLDIARLFKQLIKITNVSGGTPNVERGPAADGTLETTDYHFPGDDIEMKRHIHPMPPVEMLCERLSRWGAKYHELDGSSPYYDAIEMVRHMQKANSTFNSGADGSLYYLNHGDLFPRNIMVDVSRPSTTFVSGILDWDDAHFAPALVSFAPPTWLWTTGYWKKEGDDGQLDEDALRSLVGTEPDDEPSREIKALFDMIVGPQFLHYAYARDADVARRIWELAYRTVGLAWDEAEVRTIYNKWKSDQKGACELESERSIATPA